MRHNEPEPFVSSSDRPRWPSPTEDGEGYVARAWLPGVTVGYLVWQGDALAFYSSVSPADEAAYGVRTILRDVLDDSLAAGLSARDAWDAANAATLFEAPERRPLRAFFGELRSEWGLG